MRVYKESKVSHIKDFENYASFVCKKLNIKGLYQYGGEPKRGLYHYDSRVYPYVSTAISAGKWNTREYKQELAILAEEYKLDLNSRGTND